MANKRIRSTFTRKQRINHLANERALKQVGSLIKEERLKIQKETEARKGLFQSIKAMQKFPDEAIRLRKKDGALVFAKQKRGPNNKFLPLQMVEL